METIQADAAAPTFNDLVEAIIDDQTRESVKRCDVFRDCIKDGKVEIQSENHASEIARMVLRAERELEDVQAIADAMVARAQARVKNLEAVFLTPLAIWTSARLAGKKERSLLLEGGKLSLRKVPASVKTVDPQLLSSWAVVNLGEAVELVPKVKADVVKAWEEKSGQIAPGRAQTPESESFKVSVPAKK